MRECGRSLMTGNSNMGGVLRIYPCRQTDWGCISYLSIYLSIYVNRAVARIFENKLSLSIVLGPSPITVQPFRQNQYLSRYLSKI